jgi:hypothetical protein
MQKVGKMFFLGVVTGVIFVLGVFLGILFFFGDKFQVWK